MGVNMFYVLLLSMILVGASSVDEYYPRSNIKEASQPQSKMQSGAYNKSDVVQPAPKPEESEKPMEGKDSKSEPYSEPEFKHNGFVEKPDFHFADLPKAEPFKSFDGYDPKKSNDDSDPEHEASKLNIPKPEETFHAEPYDEHRFQHNEYSKMPDSDSHYLQKAEPMHPVGGYALKKSSYEEDPHYEASKLTIPKPEEKFHTEVYNEHQFQHNEHVEKPDFHFSNMPEVAEPTKLVGGYDPKKSSYEAEQEYEKSKSKLHIPKPEGILHAKSYDEHQSQHNEPAAKLDSQSPDMSKVEPLKPIDGHDSKKSNYEAHPEYKTPKLNTSNPEEAFLAAVEGIIICKSASGYAPIKGVMVRITCLEVEGEGYDPVPLSCQSSPTDAKGYFFKRLPSNKNVKNSLKNCKAFLEQSPLKECGVPSNVNKGIDGYSLSSHRVLTDKHIKLYTVGPFFYTPENKPTINKASAVGGY